MYSWFNKKESFNLTPSKIINQGMWPIATVREDIVVSTRENEQEDELADTNSHVIKTVIELKKA